MHADTIRVPQDFASILQASKAATDGDTILISGGSYAETLGIENITGLTLRDKGKVVLEATGSGFALAVSNAFDLLLSNLRFEGGGFGVRVMNSEGISVSKCRLRTATRGSLRTIRASSW